MDREGGKPIIFLHGLGGTGNSWIKLGPLLSEDYGLYFIDLLGHGRSDRPNIEYTIAVQAAMIEEFITEQGFEEFSLMGNSYGGWISLRYAMNKKSPSHLILEDTAGINKVPGERGQDFMNRFIERVVSGNKSNSEAVIRNIVVNNSNPVWKLTDPELKQLNVKTLIIWGKEDLVIPIDYGRRLNRLIQESRMLELEAGHVPHVTSPDRVAETVNQFLKT